MNQVDINTLEPDGYIPLFRARKLNSKEYVIGQYLKSEHENISYIIRINVNPVIGNDIFSISNEYDICEVESNTLAIHFPDMIDSEKNKIFSSLSKFGTGGDYLKFNNVENYSFVLVYQKTLEECLNIKINKKYYKNLKNLYKDITVIGIKE